MPIFGNTPGELLRTILENVRVAIAIADGGGKLVFANNTALSLFGMSTLPEQIHLKDWARGYRIQDKDGNEIPFERSAAIRTLEGEYVEPQDLRVTLPGGQTKWLHTSAHRFAIMGLAGVLIIVTDETESTELRRKAAQLRRMEDVAATAVGMANNFNNVLATISLNATLALSEEQLKDQTRGRLETITNASWKAARIVKQLTQFSRTRELQTRVVQINWLVKEVLKFAQPVLTTTLRVHALLREGLPEVEVDPAEIEQVLVNLILNAREAMPHGGDLTITTELAAGPPETGTGSERNRGQFVTISVADTGTGIEQHIQERIFDPFFTTKTAEGGTGLGLSSAYRIIRQHQGTIEVSSVPGEGTRFVIQLPLRQSAPLQKGFPAAA